MSDDPKEPDKERLIQETARYLTAYIGEIEGVRSISEGIEPMLRVNGITELLEYHFLRTGSPDSRSSLPGVGFNQAGRISNTGTSVGVLDFVEGLPKKVRSIDPSIHTEEKVVKGATEGKPHWAKTIKHRRGKAVDASRDFVSYVPARSHANPPNRVLFKLLTTVKNVYKRFDDRIKDDEERPGWFQEWEPEANARTNVEEALSSVYFDSFDATGITVSQRDIREVAGGERPLYRNAASLLMAHRRITGDEIEEEFARSLLRSDVFEPDEKDNSLYELYWLFKIVDTFQESRLEQIRDSNRGRLVARWADEESEYMLFNDWNGKYTPAPGEDDQYLLDFTPPEYNHGGDLDDTADNPTLRRASVIRYTQQIRQQGLEYNPSRQFPDIVVLKCDSDSGDLEKLFVGEVKHSVDDGYLRENAQQLLEYAMYVKTGEDLQLTDSHDAGDFVASHPNLGSSPEIEIGYFVGHTDVINELTDGGVHLYGFGDEPEFDFLI